MCEWCKITKKWWKRFLHIKYCGTCSDYFHEAGIYLQSGGPPYKQGAYLGWHE
jgi:hypothetical protein